MLLENFSVFFSAQLCMDRTHACLVCRRERLLGGTPIEVKDEETGHVRHFSRQGDHKSVFQIEFSHLVAVTQLDGHLSKRVIIKPKLLEIGQLTDLS